MKHAALLALLLPLPAAAQAPLYEHVGQAGELLGASFAGLGDVDGDGLGDYAIGVPGAGGLQPYAGQVLIVSGATGQVLSVFQGEQTNGVLGTSLAGTGDLDGDGAGDLVAGAPGYSSPGLSANGAVYLVSGATGALIKRHEGAGLGDKLGYAVACPGDVDFDGVNDYAFGAPDSDATLYHGGIVYLYSGKTKAPLRVYHSEQADSRFGYALDAAGDVNGDGVPDLLIGAPQWDLFGSPNHGKGYVVSGVAEVVLYGKLGSEANAWLGASVAGGVDVNGDGIPDAAFGEPYADHGGTTSGRVTVYSGAPGYAKLYDLDGTYEDQFGFAIDLVEDLDGDARGDLLVGAPEADAPGLPRSGRATLFNGTFGLPVYSVGGETADELLGRSVAGIGHLNLDVAVEVAIGSAWGSPGGMSQAGRAQVLLGKAPPPASYCTAKVNSAGCTPFVTSTGGLSLTAGSFDVLGMNVLSNAWGILIWSHQPKSTPFYGGTLCLQAPIKRTPLQKSASVPSALPCDGVYDFQVSQAYLLSKGVTAGDTLHFQYWSRDSGLPPPNTIGLTDALQVGVLP